MYTLKKKKKFEEKIFLLSIFKKKTIFLKRKYQIYMTEIYLGHQIDIKVSFPIFMFIYKYNKIHALGTFAKYFLFKSNKIIILNWNDYKPVNDYCK